MTKQIEEKSIKTERKEATEMIVAVINRGYADFVVDASRDAGASGATVLYGRGVYANKENAILNGVKIQGEKEIVLIVVKKSQRKKIMQEISDRTHLQEKGNGISFCVPVNKIMGLTNFETKSFKKRG